MVGCQLSMAPLPPNTLGWLLLTVAAVFSAYNVPAVAPRSSRPEIREYRVAAECKLLQRMEAPRLSIPAPELRFSPQPPRVAAWAERAVLYQRPPPCISLG